MKKSSENIARFFHWTTRPNPLSINHIYSFSCVYPVKLKNLKANHNPNRDTSETRSSVFYSSQKEIHF